MAKTKSESKSDAIQNEQEGPVTQETMPGSTSGTPSGVVQPPTDSKKGETRLYQTFPGKKEWLTKAEAKKAGFNWKETAEDKKKKS